jgi:iron complex outermembrane receptor protein
MRGTLHYGVSGLQLRFAATAVSRTHDSHARRGLTSRVRVVQSTGTDAGGVRNVRRESRALTQRLAALNGMPMLAAVLAAAAVVLALPSSLHAAEATADTASEESRSPRGTEPAVPEPPPGVEEIVVFGEVGGAMVVPDAVSVTSFDTEALVALGVQDISDLADVTPSLEINTISASTPTFFIRGVGLNDFASNATGAVAIYQDGVPINAPALQLGQLFDLEGADVLRGPQATGNERNASAGMIRANSRLPSGDVESTLRFDYSRFDSRDVEGALALPLTRDGALSTRLAFRYADRADPYVSNGCGGLAVATRGACGAQSTRGAEPVPAGLASETGDRKRWALRSLFRLQPASSDLDLILNVHGGAIDQDSELGQVIGTGGGSVRAETQSGYREPAIAAIYDRIEAELRAAGVPINPARREAKDRTLALVTEDIGRAKPFANDYNLIGREELESLGGSLRARSTLGWVDVDLVGGVESYDRLRVTDFDFSPDTAIHSDGHDYARQGTVSVDLGSELDALALHAGAFLLSESLDSDTEFLFNFARGGGAQTNQLIQQDYLQDSLGFGVYGNFDWEFHPQFTLSSGVRINWDHKEFELGVRRPNSTANFVPGSASETWMAPSGAIALRFRPTDGVELYAKYSRGWKPGLFNAAILRNSPVTSSLQPDIKLTDPEQIDSFEIGVGAKCFGDRVDWRAAAFYYKYVDYQVFMLRNNTQTPPQFEIVNADNAEIYGAELDVIAHPLLDTGAGALEDLSIDLRFGWLESEFLDFTDSRTTFLQNLVVTENLEFTGNRIANTPKFKLSTSIQLPLELSRFGTLTPRYDFSYSDDVFFDPSEGRGTGVESLPRYGIGQKAYALHHLRLSYRLPGDQIEVSGWVRNLLDEKYKTYAADATAILSILNWIGEPRTYGISFGFEW